jgi:hypothetical protein
MNGKEIITNDEIMKEAKRWLASFTNEELSRKIDEIEKKFSAELEEIRNSAWLKGEENEDKKKDTSIECTITTKEDEKREFNWSLSKMPIDLQKVYEIKAFDYLNEAAA